MKLSKKKLVKLKTADKLKDGACICIVQRINGVFGLRATVEGKHIFMVYRATDKILGYIQPKKLKESKK